jgi:hypothetical protein
MPRFLLLATLTLVFCAAANNSHAQRAMAHPLPRPTAAKPPAPATTHPQTNANGH